MTSTGHPRTAAATGLLLAVELHPELLPEGGAATIAGALLAAGVVVNPVTPTALRLAPSLLISDDEVDSGVAAIAKVLADTCTTPDTKDAT